MPDEKSEELVEEAKKEVEEIKDEVKEVDYDAELKEAERKAQAETFYQKRHEKDESKEDDSNDKSDDLADRVVAKILPKVQASVESTVLESKLETLSKGNQSLKKLIKFHLENSVNPNLDLDARLEIAYAAANKKNIERAASEINIANQNRSQISNLGQGANEGDGVKVKDNILSEEQIKELNHKADVYSFNEKQRKNFIEGVRNRLAQNKR